VRNVRGGRAVAVDRDAAPLNHRRADPRVRKVVGDVRHAAARADLLVALNFSLCEFHERRDLVAYLRHARRRLQRGGVFVADLYGGEGAFDVGRQRERHQGPRGERVLYEFEQRKADALTGRVVDALHFEVAGEVAGDVAGNGAAARRRGFVTKLRDAFVYDWRLWSIPELRDALGDAGFAKSEVYSRFEHARDGRGRTHVRALESSRELGATWCVFLAGRT
jgi:SAM-dependent methyltransferase